MKYPLPDEYHQAVQNPQTCFSNSDLKHGKIDTHANGMPTVRSGNFASVYKVQNGNRAFAVRCFIRHFADVKDRYQTISGYLSTISSKYFVVFQYLENEMNVRNKLYPVLKMDWIEGKSFDSFIMECIKRNDRQGVSSTRLMFVDLVRELRKYKVSHCDLQHGNILMTAQGLKLVDYDGMYVPNLQIQHSNETGHPNYQHPERKGYDFNPFIDNFSAMVIFTALSVLLYDFTFWTRYDNGDNFLFTEKDFRNCDNSPLFKELDSLRDVEIKKLASELRAACKKPVAQCPDFFSLVGSVLPVSPSATNSTSWIKTWEAADTQQGNQLAVQAPAIDWIPSWLQKGAGVLSPSVIGKLSELICCTNSCRKFRKKTHKAGSVYCDTCGVRLVKDTPASHQPHGFGLKCCMKCNAKINQSFVYCPNCGGKA